MTSLWWVAEYASLADYRADRWAWLRITPIELPPTDALAMLARGARLVVRDRA